MPANKFYRVVEGPVVRDGVVVVPRDRWAVLCLDHLPDDEDAIDDGAVAAVCRTEQEAERVARDRLFPAGVPEVVDVLDSFPEGEPDGGEWEMEPLPEEDDGGADDDNGSDVGDD